MRLLLAFLLLCGVAMGNDFEVKKGEKTANDDFAEVTIDGMYIKRPQITIVDEVTIDGKIKNTSDKEVSNVEIGIGLYDKNDKLLRRSFAKIKPKIIKPNESSYFQVVLDVEKKAEPTKVEWVIIGAD